MVGTNLVESKNTGHSVAGDESGRKQFVTMTVGGQMFGIPVLLVHDVLRPQKITRIALADPVIMGAINLRGRIVTVIDMRRVLGLPPIEGGKKIMQVVVDHNDDQYSLVVDSVEEVMNVSQDDFESTPSNFSEKWRAVSAGVYRLKTKILVVLDVQNILKF